MNSAPVSFYEIVQAVKDETGIENIEPLYEKLRRYVFNAEREIGYGGSVVLKKAIFQRNVNFDGNYFPYPKDYIEFEGVGDDCGQVGFHRYGFTPTGIRLAQRQEKAVFLYWGLMCDGYGNPITTRNHEFAVVAYCVWKLYKVRRFLDKGNANTAFDYEQSFNSKCEESRGDDAWPTLEQWNQLSVLSYTDRRGLLQLPYSSFDYSCDLIPQDCEHIIPDTSDIRVHFWQAGIDDDLASVLGNISRDFLDEKESHSLTIFNQGMVVNYYANGKACFAITKIEDVDLVIFDALGNEITDLFEMTYILEFQCILFVSILPYNGVSIYFQIKQQ